MSYFLYSPPPHIYSLPHVPLLFSLPLIYPLSYIPLPHVRLISSTPFPPPHIYSLPHVPLLFSLPLIYPLSYIPLPPVCLISSTPFPPPLIYIPSSCPPFYSPPSHISPPAANAFVSELVAIITHPEAREDDREGVTENALFTLGSIATLPTYREAQYGLQATPAQLSSLWLKNLPLKTDEQIAKLAHCQLCSAVERGDVAVLGEGMANLPELMRIFSEILVTVPSSNLSHSRCLPLPSFFFPPLLSTLLFLPPIPPLPPLLLLSPTLPSPPFFSFHKLSIVPTPSLFLTLPYPNTAAVVKQKILHPPHHHPHKAVTMTTILPVSPTLTPSQEYKSW